MGRGGIDLAHATDVAEAAPDQKIEKDLVPVHQEKLTVPVEESHRFIGMFLRQALNT